MFELTSSRDSEQEKAKEVQNMRDWCWDQYFRPGPVTWKSTAQEYHCSSNGKMEREVDTLLEDVVFLDYGAFELKPWNTYLTGCFVLFSLFGFTV